MQKLSDLFKSRKFWGAVVALVIIFTGERAGLSAEVVQNAVYTLIAFILGTGLEDAKAKG